MRISIEVHMNLDRFQQIKHTPDLKFLTLSIRSSNSKDKGIQGHTLTDVLIALQWKHSAFLLDTKHKEVTNRAHPLECLGTIKSEFTQNNPPLNPTRTGISYGGLRNPSPWIHLSPHWKGWRLRWVCSICWILCQFIRVLSDVFITFQWKRSHPLNTKHPNPLDFL